MSRGDLRFSHFSIAVMHDWNSRICRRMVFAFLAPSISVLPESAPDDAAYIAYQYSVLWDTCCPEVWAERT